MDYFLTQPILNKRSKKTPNKNTKSPSILPSLEWVITKPKKTCWLRQETTMKKNQEID